VRRISLLWIILFSTCILVPVVSQTVQPVEADIDEALSYLRNKVLDLEIHARIIGEDRESVWNAETREMTVSGKSVSITLEGDNLKVVALLIPFLNDDHSMFLVAKGEVWLQERPGEEKKYYSTVKSLPIQAGESVIFFPTGTLMDSDSENIYTIELEIQVEPRE